MNFNKIIMCSIIFLISLNQTSIADNKWILTEKKDGIEVFIRNTEGDIYEVRAITHLNAKIDEIGKILKDLESYPKWMPGCSEIKVLKEIDENNLIFYTVSKVPWPFSDRDAIIKVTIERDLKKKIVKIKTEAINENIVPLNSDYVRITELKESWILNYIKENKTRLTITSKGDPAGAIPAWAVNIFVKDSLYEPIVNLKKIIQSNAY
ncbi:MAG: hypothetical protein GY714_14990 [Desulfobacterales bacterium]|nr:hypothetical protein [Desulfobacterales bacterium]